MSVPDKTHYFRVYVEKYYTIKKYALYGRYLGGGSREVFIRYGFENDLTKENVYAKQIH
ncbi:MULTISPECIES: hypothetical protein [unclassified Lactococcus]|uniref:hypothetical protein n=1 Tax=unclassified Lactococcus TaxID=2643510 RepID=UPI0012970EE9|nr:MULTISPECIES: hypothetical protein [unclassified Lactococcus]MQW22863.1 hypothetical protein [Lactococcus sp. dk101]